MTTTPFPHVAVFGLAVMGENLARNIESRGFPVTIYNRTAKVTEEFLNRFPDQRFIGAFSIEELIEKTASPRSIILMIKAGPAVDHVLDELIPHLEKGDIIIDGGNALYTDTERRVQTCAENGIEFLGVGISGGEEGALRGPSIMPGGSQKTWEHCSELFAKIAAQVDGEPCTDYVGPGGAGHFVKMVHNGIEYADMQLIAEAYFFMKEVLRLDNESIASFFSKWNRGRLNSYLMEITVDILRKKSEDSSQSLVDLILDKAGQKGTGRWTVQASLELGVPIPTISAAVDARGMSALKELRVEGASRFDKLQSNQDLANQDLESLEVDCIEQALFSGKVIAYAQGMALIQESSRVYNWNLKLDRIAKLWRGGCIIRAALLSEISEAFRESPKLSNLIFAGTLQKQLEDSLAGLRKVVATSALAGVPVLGLSSALSYLESFTTAFLPQNLIQAQRDYFGAHTYERVDREGVFHTEWAGEK
ncbi:NADP-dependent phosphogluconate dehydrogenase [bacterium]|nr:NADP-dependent phosphogluconate dehydrogenase [bacterium]